MDADYIIATARRADVDAIYEIERVCFGADSFSRRQISYLVSRASGAFFVVRCGERVAAYISLLTKRRAANVRIYSVAVHPDFAGHHIGQALIERAREYAAACGAKHLTLEVNPRNAAAVGLYRKNGFRTTSTLDNYYHDGSPAERMSVDV